MANVSTKQCRYPDLVEGPMGYVHPLTPNEITIEIMPRGQVVYWGTWEQLRQEGVLPEGARADGRHWTEGIYWYWLNRCRPKDAKFRDCPGCVDYWRLYVRLAEQGCDGFAAAKQYALEQELERARFNLTSAGKLQERAWWRALDDEKFQGLLLQVGAKEPPRTRKPRARRSIEAASK